MDELTNWSKLLLPLAPRDDREHGEFMNVVSRDKPLVMVCERRVCETQNVEKTHR